MQPSFFINQHRICFTIHLMPCLYLLVQAHLFVVMKIASTLNCSPYMAGTLSATSYVTVVFYTKTFSNSVEAFFFSLLLLSVTEYVQFCKTKISKSPATKVNVTSVDSSSSQSIPNGESKPAADSENSTAAGAPHSSEVNSSEANGSKDNGKW